MSAFEGTLRPRDKEAKQPSQQGRGWGLKKLKSSSLIQGYLSKNYPVAESAASHWRAPLRRAVVGPQLAGAPQERWLVRHWQAPLKRAVVGLPLAAAPQKWLVCHLRAPLRRAVAEKIRPLS